MKAIKRPHSGLNSNLPNVRYNEENDYIETFFNGEWHKITKAKLQNTWVIQNGIIVSEESKTENYVTQNDNNVSVGVYRYGGYLVFNIDLTDYSTVRATYSSVSVGSDAWETFAIFNNSFTISNIDSFKSNAVKSNYIKSSSSLEYTDYEFDVSALSGKHKIAFATYNRTITISELSLIYS